MPTSTSWVHARQGLVVDGALQERLGRRPPLRGVDAEFPEQATSHRDTGDGTGPAPHGVVEGVTVPAAACAQRLVRVSCVGDHDIGNDEDGDAHGELERDLERQWLARLHLPYCPNASS